MSTAILIIKSSLIFIKILENECYIAIVVETMLEESMR